MEDYRLEQSGQEVQDILNGAAMQTDLTAENERAEQAEQTLQGNIDAEEERAKAAEKQNADDIDAIEEKIPSGASEQNKLVDQQTMNSSIATATATYRGAYNLVSDLGLTVSATEQQIAEALATKMTALSITPDNNDYCYVQVPTSDATPTQIARVDRYKYNGTAWGFEYSLNNSGFTAAQWAALNSGITSGLVTKLSDLPTYTELMTLFNGKQNTLTFDSTPTAGSNNPVTSNGIQQSIGTIEEKIPSGASSQNKLVDQQTMNSSIATATATYRGAYNLVSDLSLTVSATEQQIAAALATKMTALSITPDNNDYCYVQVPTSDATPTQIARVDRYKYDGTAWGFEYSLNNSGFTAAQWAALNSGITSGLVAKLSDLPSLSELTALLAGKQNTLTFDSTPTAGSSNPVTSNGIKQAIDAHTVVTDATPTAGSTNPVQSGGVKTYVDNIASQIDSQVSQNTSDISALQALYNALQQSEPEVIQPTDTWPVANPSDTVIYRVIDRVNTPPQYYSDYMWNGTSMVLMATYNNAVDSVPTNGSHNLVESGGVYNATNIFKDIEDSDFSICDERGNVLAEFKEGDVLTKNFNSKRQTYIRNTADDSDFIICDEEGNAILEIKDGNIITKNFNNDFIDLSGKKVLFFGDSITYYKEYVNAFASKTNCIAYNRGLGSSCISNGGGAGIPASFCTRVDLTADNTVDGSGMVIGLPSETMDYVIIQGGINDFGYANAGNKTAFLGDIGVADSVNARQSLYGGLKYVINKIKNLYPNAVVAVLGLIPTYSTGEFLKWSMVTLSDPSDVLSTLSKQKTTEDRSWFDYNEALENVALQFGAKFVSMENLGFNPLISSDRTKFYRNGDGLHPNNAGGELISNRIINILLKN